MRSRNLVSSAVAMLALGALGISITAARRGDRVERIDFHTVVTATTPAWDARVAPASDATIREFVIPITHDTIEISKGVKYEGWTFGGTVPGPVLRVREGDLVRVKVINESPMPHSIDFHAARIPANKAY
jgi:FtsP/CotA-like multicopper oxidase with cupredoxin domain